MPTPEKINIVEQVKKTLEDHKNLVITDYRGLTVESITELRRQLREQGIVYQVVKNNLASIALRAHNIDGLDDYLVGPTAIAYAQKDPVVPCKILVEFSKKGTLKIKGGFADGKVINANEVEELSKLPSKEVLIGKLLGTLNAPATRLVNVLQGPIRNLVYVLSEISKQKSN